MGNIPTTVDSILGPYDVSCVSCERPIALPDDRRRCANCARDFCLTCEVGEEHSDHKVALLKGFPELQDDLAGLSRRSARIFETLNKSFHVEENVYFRLIVELVKFLESEQHPAAGTDFGQWAKEHGEAVLRRYLSLKEMGRFVDYFDRRAFAGTSIDIFTLTTSQGTIAPITWQGLPMMRTVWDFALAPVMVQEIQPRSIIEIGTASGGAAGYYASLQREHGLQPNVITVDINPPSVAIAGVTFMKGDAHRIAESLTAELLERQPHPWIVVEDAHYNIGGIFEHFDAFLQEGDYFCIEDIDAELDLYRFLEERRNYKVDTRYTDFFGHNTTSCPDQIFCKRAL